MDKKGFSYFIRSFKVILKFRMMKKNNEYKRGLVTGVSLVLGFELIIMVILLLVS